jgi:hypothetical protein
MSLHTGNFKLAHSLHKGIESNKILLGFRGSISGQQHGTVLPTSNFNLAASNFFKTDKFRPSVNFKVTFGLQHFHRMAFVVQRTFQLAA